MWLFAHPLTALAQIRIQSVAAEVGSPTAGSAAIFADIPGQTPNAVLLPNSLSPSLGVAGLAPAPVPVIGNVAVAKSVAVNAAVGLNVAIPAALISASPSPVSVGIRAGKVTPSVAVISVQPLIRSEKAVAVVRDEVATWETRLTPDDVPAPSFHHDAPALSANRSAASVNESPRDVPVPSAKAPNPGSPRLTQALVLSGSQLLAAAAVSVFLPRSFPPSSSHIRPR